MNKISVLPIWKNGDTVTAADRFDELANMARSDPEMFKQFVVVWRYDTDSGFGTKYIKFGADTVQAIGLMELGKIDFARDSER